MKPKNLAAASLRFFSPKKVKLSKGGAYTRKRKHKGKRDE